VSERAFALLTILAASCLVALAVLTITDRMTPALVAALEGR